MFNECGYAVQNAKMTEKIIKENERFFLLFTTNLRQISWPMSDLKIFTKNRRILSLEKPIRFSGQNEQQYCRVTTVPSKTLWPLSTTDDPTAKSSNIM